MANVCVGVYAEGGERGGGALSKIRHFSFSWIKFFLPPTKFVCSLYCTKTLVSQKTCKISCE